MRRSYKVLVNTFGDEEQDKRIFGSRKQVSESEGSARRVNDFLVEEVNGEIVRMVEGLSKALDAAAEIESKYVLDSLEVSFTLTAGGKLALIGELHSDISSTFKATLKRKPQ